MDDARQRWPRVVAHMIAESLGHCTVNFAPQNPADGGHTQYRNHSDLGEICLRCYQDEVLKSGQPRSDFEGERVRGGMFFSSGNREPLAAGFEEVDGFRDFCVIGQADARKYNRHTLALIDASAQVMTAYERMAIGGLEGYITMLARPHRPEKLPREVHRHSYGKVDPIVKTIVCPQ